MLPPPNLIGAPERYDRWRNMQAEAVLAAIDSKKRFIVTGAPTGFGKSLVYISHGLLTEGRTVILTSTKALQSQLVGDFRESGLIEIKGLNAYECVEGRPTGRFGDMRREGFRADRGLPMACDEAPCQAGAFCPKRDNGCTYYDAYRLATMPKSRLIVTNYAYWMSINKFGEGLGKIDLLVLDEAHNAIDELGSFIGTELRPSEVEVVLPNEARIPDSDASLNDWREWAREWLEEVDQQIEHIKSLIRDSERGNGGRGERLSYGTLRKARDLKRLQHKLATVANMAGEWIIDHTEDHHKRPLVRFDPIWPGEYAESSLFLGVPKVVMMSATVRPKTATMLGVHPNELDFREYPSVIPKERRPIVYHPVMPMNMKSEKANGTKEMSTRVDQIIGRRLDRKALIQTVSYQRARQIYLASEYRHMMIIHDSTNTREMIEQFKQSTKPVIMVSPVLDTGYDFPYEQAEYQILVKVPFPVTVDKIMKARTERDAQYRDYVTMITIVQMAGRICRAPDDMGETFILDADFGWWFNRHGIKLAPRWFTEALRTEQSLGLPLPKLKRGKR